MNKNISNTGSEAEWNAAYSRLEDYLRALHITNQKQRDQIIEQVLGSAVAKQAEHPGLCPTALVMTEIRAAMHQWFEQILPARERVPVLGITLLAATDAAEKWPTAFLAAEIPADFQRALRASEVRAAPELQVGSMVPQPFVNPLRDVINPPRPLQELARDMAPLLTKVSAFVLSALSILSGLRLR